MRYDYTSPTREQEHADWIAQCAADEAEARAAKIIEAAKALAALIDEAESCEDTCIFRGYDWSDVRPDLEAAGA